MPRRCCSCRCSRYGRRGPDAGTAWITFLDVGQGLAVLVRTSDHALLYDAGPTYGPDADAGSRVVVPFLRGEGLARLDALVITHDDADHSGGAVSVMRTIPVDVLWSSLAEAHPARGLRAGALALPRRRGVGVGRREVRAAASRRR